VFTDCFIHLPFSLQLFIRLSRFCFQILAVIGWVLSLRHHGSEVQETGATVAAGGLPSYCHLKNEDYCI